MKKLLVDIDKKYKQLEVLDKKKKRMGLDSEEKKMYGKYIGKLMQMRIELSDRVFDDFVMPFIIDERVADILADIYVSIGWNLEVLIYDDAINRLIKKYRECRDKERLLKDVDKVYRILVENLKKYLEKLDEEEKRDIALVVSTFNTEEDLDFDKEIIDFLDYKFYGFYIIIEEVRDEEVEEDE